MATTTTNKTTHYELSQYTANDKTSYLVNYNSDMSVIDSGIYNAQAKADTNGNAIGDLSNLTTDVKSSLVSALNEVDSHTDENTTHIGNLSNLATYENSDLVRAINEVDSNTNTNTGNIGNLTDLETTIKSNLVGAINEVNTDTPIGAIMPYAGTSAPSKYLICDGSAVSRTTYEALYSIIGTRYGNGDGSTTFNLPNLKGRTIVGRDLLQSDFHEIGATGGEKVHLLTVNEIPSHNHDINIPKMLYSDVSSGSVLGGESIVGQTTHQTGNTGGGQAHNNMQPYIVLNYIIRYK